MYQRFPDDPTITDMDPVQKMWLFYQWLGDHRDEAELVKNHAYLLGSFTNPEAVNQILNPNAHESTDEEYEESLKMVQDFNTIPLHPQDNVPSVNENQQAKKRHRKRTLLKDKS